VVYILYVNKEYIRMNRVEKAVEFHNKGYNCGQSVACAFSDIAGVDEETLFRITEGMGLGMGCMEGTCGAVSGAVAILGLKNSTANLEKPNSKAATYQLSKRLVQEFKNKNQSLVCKDLKGVETNKVLRSCQGCIEDAVMILDEILKESEK
jgi:C_GCAxxG_C_C family probable redox protein